MDGLTEDPMDSRSTVGKLVELASSVETEDLSGLAKMHGWCEALAQTWSSEGDDLSPARAERLGSMAHALETIILGEADDPLDALVSIRAAIDELAREEGIPSAQEGRPVAQPALTDAEVAQKLACVFDDDASPTDLQGLTGTVDSVAGPSDAADTDQVPAPLEGSESGGLDATAEAREAVPAECRGAETSKPPYDQQPLIIDQKEFEFVATFMEEATEHIEAIEAAVLEVERTPGDSAKINDLFRPFHTIKGAAGFLNLCDINVLTHEIETLLDQARKGERDITPGLIDLIFDAVDILKVQFSAISNHVADPADAPVPQPPIVETVSHLRDVVAGRAEPISRESAPGSAAQRVGENLVEQGAVPQEVVDYAVDARQSGRSDKKTGEILLESKAVTPKQVSQAIRPQVQVTTGAAERAATGVQPTRGDQSVRIETTKLDALVDMVGELVIAQTQVSANATPLGDSKLIKSVGQTSKIIRDVQEVAMAMRMVPIGPTFQKMARLVRDVSRKAGKKVEFTISGEDTELDKNVIQQIGDPLVHMIRNAVDHGIELPEVRREAGKSEAGAVYLGASHQGGNIAIEIRDDGRGLDPDALIAKAIERGVLQPGAELPESEAFGLIFAPGFSTAKEVTDISGRGVGMDVVRRNIEQLRGKVDIFSTKGIGSTFTIRLPLTLAIIDGMIIMLGGERFIIPTIAIEQSLRPRREQITTVQEKGEVLNIRGQLIPLVQLGLLFRFCGRVDPCEAMVVIAQCDDGRKIGIVANELLDQQQVVIKSLGERFRKLRAISGAAILGDGRVGLILEASGIAAAHDHWRGSSLQSVARLQPAGEVDDQHSVEVQAGEPRQSEATTVDEGERKSAAETIRKAPQDQESAVTALV